MKKVMILGAGMLQAFVIRRAKELGYYTIAVDMDEQAVGFQYADESKVVNIVDQEACLRCAREENIDGVLTAATDYGVLSASYIAQSLGLSGIPYETARLIKNKFHVRRALSEAKADDTPQFFEVADIGDIESITQSVVFPVMVKPCDGSGSKGAGKADNISQLKELAQQALDYSLAKRALIETFIDGHEYGVESFVYEGRIHVVGVLNKTMTAPPYYAELGHCIPSGLSEPMEDKVKRTAVKTIEALGITFGAVNMDVLITDDDKVCLVDIGARMGGNLIGSHIIPLAAGIDYMGNIIRASAGDAVDFHSNGQRAIATALLALTPGVVAQAPDIEALKAAPGVVDIIFNKRVGDPIREYKNNLDGCGYVVAAGKTADSAQEKAAQIRRLIDEQIH